MNIGRLQVIYLPRTMLAFYRPTKKSRHWVVG